MIGQATAGLCYSLLITASVATARPWSVYHRALAAIPAKLQVKTVGISSDVLTYDYYSGLRYTRDGGYVSTIGNKTFVMNYDTLLCDDSMSDCSWVGSNTLTYLSNLTRTETDPAGNADLCAINTQTGAFETVWLTNAIALNDTHGVIWFFNHEGQNSEPTINSGVAIIDVSADSPVCTRVTNNLFAASDVPMYGFHGAIRGRRNDSYIYLYGSDMSAGAVRGGWGTVYLARVQPRMAGSAQAYQYWNGYTFVRSQAAAAPIMWDTVPGSVSYSHYQQSYLYLYPSDPFGSIFAKTAPTPSGPWSNETTVFNGGLYYSPQVLPYPMPNGSYTMMYSTQDQYTGAFYQRTINITLN